MSFGINPAPGAVIMAEKWPRIARFLEGEPTGWVVARFNVWDIWTRATLSPTEQAAAYEEWADFYLWRLESASDHLQRRGLEHWTDDMVYVCRRCAAYARGENPGEWVPSWQRRQAQAQASEVGTELGAA